MTTASDDGPECPTCGIPMAPLSEDQEAGWGCVNQECSSYNASVGNPPTEQDERTTPATNTDPNTATGTVDEANPLDAFRQGRKEAADAIKAQQNDGQPDTDSISSDGADTDDLQCMKCDEPLEHHQPECPYCGFTLPSMGKSLVTFAIGAVLTITIIGAIIGIPMMITAVTGASVGARQDHPNSIAIDPDKH